MTFTQKITALATTAIVAVALSTSGLTPAKAATDDSAAATQGDRPLFANPFDPSTWYDASEGADHASHEALPLNPAHPSFWLSIMDPQTHTARHMQFTNPATYAELLDPGFYMQFANPENYVAWMNPSSYAMLTKVETYTYWMQPGAYMHAMQADGYMQAFNLENYQDFIDPATYTQMFDPAAYDIEQTAAGIEQTMETFSPANVLAQVKGLLPASE